MALLQKVYGIKTPSLAHFFCVYGVLFHCRKARKPLEIRHFIVLKLELELVGDESDEFGIGGFAFCVADGIAEETLEGVKIATIPSHLDGVANGPLHTGRRGLESLCYLGI